jgi:RecB family exonuclease
MNATPLTRSTAGPRLPEDFRFSQTSLQVFDDCKRRFWLSYMQQTPWPSVQASPIAEHERVMRLGQAFHRLVERAEEGVHSDDDRPSAHDLETPLADWYRAYLQHRPADLPNRHVEVERVLEAPFALDDSAVRLVAKYDLIAADDQSRAVIIDWKTGRKRSDPTSLYRRLQTALYLYVLVEASSRLPWGPIAPEQAEMRYWFVAAPEHPITFRYDTAQHEANRNRIAAIIRRILAGESEADFPKVADTEINRKYLCGFCTYRGLCDRGERATSIDEWEDAESPDIHEAYESIDFGLEDVGELAF